MGHTQLCSRMEGGCIEKYAHVCMCVCVKEPRGRGEIHTKEEGVMVSDLSGTELIAWMHVSAW